MVIWRGGGCVRVFNCFCSPIFGLNTLPGQKLWITVGSQWDWKRHLSLRNSQGSRMGVLPLVTMSSAWKGVFPGREHELPAPGL